MCGITGGCWRNPSSSLHERLDAAVSAMRLRGPNDQGYELHSEHGADVALGHTRLSIIDLSDAGHQPMYSEDRQLGLVFNGEIYNYKELKAELSALGFRFNSDSDTEVLLAAWQHWGAACLPRLIGMFAFVVFDKAAHKLTCVRDAFGIKPFFYTVENGNFLFASEIPALKVLKSEKVVLDWQRASDYLSYGDYDSGPRSFLRGVSHLMPGCILEVDTKTGSLAEPKAWWKVDITQRAETDFKEASEILREKFLSNISLHLRSDVPLGAALSGGIDSSAVVCAMRHIAPDTPIHTFSYIARGTSVSEEAWVDNVNQHVGAVPHKVFVSPDELAQDIDDMILAQGEPFGSTSIYAQYRVFKLAKEHSVTVTLDGQGADELLAGYSGYPGQRIHSLLDEHRYLDALRFFDSWSQWPGRTKAKGIKALANELGRNTLYQKLRKHFRKHHGLLWLNHDVLQEAGVKSDLPRFSFDSKTGRRVAAELRLSLTRRGLPALLRHGDRNSMRFSVESRVPFLTTDMAEFVLGLPEEYLISRDGETKRIFRAAMRGIVPDEILDRRDKIGFSTPEQAWLISISETARKWLQEDLGLPFFNQSEVLREFDLIISGKKAFSWQVWRWINFSRWYVTLVR